MNLDLSTERIFESPRAALESYLDSVIGCLHNNNTEGPQLEVITKLGISCILQANAKWTRSGSEEILDGFHSNQPVEVSISYPKETLLRNEHVRASLLQKIKQRAINDLQSRIESAIHEFKTHTTQQQLEITYSATINQVTISILIESQNGRRSCSSSINFDG